MELLREAVKTRTDDLKGLVRTAQPVHGFCRLMVHQKKDLLNLNKNYCQQLLLLNRKNRWHPMHCQSTSAYTNRTFSPLGVDTLSLSIACFRILNAEAFDANKS